MDSGDILALLVRGTLAASFGILVVIALRGAARRAFGARIAYGLWLMVPAAVIASYVPRHVVLAAPSAGSGGLAAPGSVVAPIPAGAGALDYASSTGAMTLPGLATAIIMVWLLGVLVSLLVVAISQRRIVGRLGLRRDGPIFRAASDAVGPAVVGVVVPRIIIPAGFEQRYDDVERKLVLAHERAHIRAGDAQINALAALAQCLNWFNPLFYLARRALRVDQELACDERVMRRHAGDRRAYAEAMLKTQLTAQAIPLGCHWPALGASALKERITMLRRPAPAPIVRVIGALACAGAVATASAAAWAAKAPAISYVDTGRQVQADPGAGRRALGGQLIEALQEGKTDRARQLIEAGADVNRLRLGDGTPLTMAARQGDVAAARLLLSSGADVNLAAHGDGNPLIVAAGEGNLELVALFVSAGADVNAYVPSDETPLITAARRNQLEAARFLIEAGADVNLAVDAPTLSGLERRSPLSVARRGGDREMIRLLRAHGASS